MILGLGLAYFINSFQLHLCCKTKETRFLKLILLISDQLQDTRTVTTNKDQRQWPLTDTPTEIWFTCMLGDFIPWKFFGINCFQKLSFE